jgi:branched-chain amino acid transport system substrate-binding protein
MSRASLRKTGFALLALAATAIAGAAQAQAQGDIVIGAVYPLTGGVSYDGITKLNGARVAIEEINASGGVLGRKLRLAAEDGACNPNQSVAAAEKLITNEKVVALFGALCSSASGAVGETVKKHGLPMISGVSTAERLTEVGNPWFFRATTTTRINGLSLSQALLGDGKGKRVAFIVTSDDWGRSAAQAYGASFEKLGATVVATEFFDRNDTDMTIALTKIRAARPDAVFSVGGFQNAANVTMQARQLGLRVPVLGEGAFATEPWAKLVGEFTGNVVGILEWVPGIDDAVNRKFVAAYQAAYKESATKFSAAGYNTVHILVDAIKRAGSTEPEAVRKALAATDYTGLMGNYKFDAQGQAYNFNVFLVEWKNGQSTVLRSAQIARQ